MQIANLGYLIVQQEMFIRHVFLRRVLILMWLYLVMQIVWHGGVDVLQTALELLVNWLELVQIIILLRRLMQLVRIGYLHVQLMVQLHVRVRHVDWLHWKSMILYLVKCGCLLVLAITINYLVLVGHVIIMEIRLLCSMMPIVVVGCHIVWQILVLQDV
jgi:hypothetical protein